MSNTPNSKTSAMTTIKPQGKEFIVTESFPKKKNKKPFPKSNMWHNYYKTSKHIKEICYNFHGKPQDNSGTKNGN